MLCVYVCYTINKDQSINQSIKYLSLTLHVKSIQCIYVGDQEGLCFCTLEQNRPYSACYRCTLVLILRLLQFHTICREFITELASPILRRTSGRHSAVAIRTLLTAKVDELLYSFNWYTVYEDCQRRVTCTHVLEFGHDNLKPSIAVMASIGGHCLLGADQT